MVLKHKVTSEDDGKRAVDVLCARTGMSRLLTKKIRLYGSLLVDGTPARMIDPVHEGQSIVASFGHGSNGCRLRSVPGVEVLYADDWIVVVSKPSGMVTHPTYLHGRDGLTVQLSPDPLHPVNRLDRDTSGLVVLALNGHAHHVLVQSGMTKEYIGLVHGVFDPPAGRVDAPIGRSPHSIMERIVDWSGNGRVSATRYETMQVFGEGAYSLVRFHLETGRTHQIRVHCLYAGHALVGDSLYPQEKKYDGSWLPDPVDLAMGRQALHASGTSFAHPVTGLQLDFHAGIPADMRRAIRMAASPLSSRT